MEMILTMTETQMAKRIALPMMVTGTRIEVNQQGPPAALSRWPLSSFLDASLYSSLMSCTMLIPPRIMTSILVGESTLTVSTS